MEADQNLLDAQNNRIYRSVIEKILLANIAASIKAFAALAYIYRNYDVVSDSSLNIVGFYPEFILIGNVTVYAKIATTSSNIFCILQTKLHFRFMKPEIIRNRYARQDRKQLLASMSVFFSMH